MSTIASTDTRRYPPKKLALLAAIGAIVGGALGYAGPSLLRQLHVSPRSLGWMDLLALWIGTVFLGYALLFGALSTNRRQLARILEGEQATVPATQQEVSTTRFQTVVLLLAGLLLMLPIFVQNLIVERPALGMEFFAAIVILFAVQTWGNLRIWSTSDEFARRIILEVCALSFALCQGLLFLWASAEHLHLVRAISAWNTFSLLMLVYLLSTSWITIRNARC